MSLRKANSALIVACMASAAALAVAAAILLKAYDRSEEEFAAQKQREVKAQMDSLWDDFRSITKTFGFNVLILPKDQNLSDFYSKDFATRFMPESYGATLLNSGIISVEHLDPTLVVKTSWPEQRRTIVACGSRGELSRGMPDQARAPMAQAVAPGTVVAGYDLARACGLHPGRRVLFMGRPFTVASCRPRQGNRDDITLWFDLSQAQELFNKRGLINAICALECRCTADRTLSNIAAIRSDLERILPNTQVVESMSEVLTRAEARYEQERMAKETITRELASREAGRTERLKNASHLLAMLLFALALGAGILLHANASERRLEIGVLRAVGASKRSIIALFLYKALMCGFFAAVIGIGAGWVAGAALNAALYGVGGGFDVSPFVAVGALTLLAAAVAGWPAAFRASLVDPAQILGEE